jgi:hypothetical protein
VNKVILNWQRPLWERDQEVVMRSGRNEPMWVAIYKCMEATLGISLYSYLYPKLAKTLCLSYYLCFLFNKIREEEGRTGSAWKQREVGEWPKQCTHMSKCKNDKMNNFFKRYTVYEKTKTQDLHCIWITAAGIHRQ